MSPQARAQLEVEVETGSGALGLDLPRRLVAEALGTGFLVIAVIGSGIMASRLSPDDVGLQLLENAAATAGALIGLILMLGAVSGAHFNPVVTLVDRLFGTLSTRDGIGYVAAQMVGGVLGTIVANLMFELPALGRSTTTRSSGGLWLSEVVATAGLLLVIHGCVRTGRASTVPFAVGLWIGGAYWFTSSTSFANPAVTVARTMSDSFAGIEPSSAPMFVVMQLVGAACAFVLIRFLYPRQRVEKERAVRPSVLFLCVHNAGRSQMAAAWMRHLAGNMITVYSGGSEPADRVNPAAVAAMAAVGIDITSEVPRTWSQEDLRTADVVVTMGCGDACPLVPGKRYEDWQVDDPVGLDVVAVIPIRDDIRIRVEQLMASLGVSPAHAAC